ncbi:MAG TPA: hypothetical protein VHV79_06225 [Mycobacteriales bacterium]|nr:hypothetical protein [Mycobacteriales bacterium]
MDDQIGYRLEALALDTNRCSQWSATAVRRRGDRRRTTSRLAATGVTVTLVGATAGTAFAVAQQPAGPHGSVSPAGQASQSQSQSPAPVPSVTSSQPTARPSSPGATAPTSSPTPTDGHRGTAAATTSSSPEAGHRGSATPTPTPTAG